jgi:hypothetical protein
MKLLSSSVFVLFLVAMLSVAKVYSKELDHFDGNRELAEKQNDVFINTEELNNHRMLEDDRRGFNNGGGGGRDRRRRRRRDLW